MMARVQDRSGFDTDTRMTLLEGDADHLEATVAGIQASMKKLSTALNAAAITLGTSAVLLAVNLLTVR